MTKEEYIRKVVEEKGEDWVVAAMVEGSIGYHTPHHARRLIRDYLGGRKRDACERCLCCYGGNLEEMIWHDIKAFEYVEEKMPQKARKLIEVVKEWEKLDSVDATAVGLMYPTMMV